MATPDPLHDVSWGSPLLTPVTPPADLVARIRAEHGMVPGWVGYLAPAPWVAAAFSSVGAAPVTALPMRMWEQVNLVVSRDNSCRFCYGAQRAFLRVVGYRDADIARLEERLDTAGADAPEQAMLDFARSVSRASPRPSARQRAALEAAGLSRLAIAELGFAAAAAVFANRVSTLLAFPTEPFVRVVGTPVVSALLPYLGPLLALRFRLRLRAPAPLPTRNEGCGAAVVAALDGSPAAGVLRRIIDEALASPVLPARTKLLAFAVIARTLGCAAAEADARAALAARGVPEEVADEALAHLGGAGLDPLEARLVPFARDTVRVQPEIVQPRMRDVASGLSTAQVVEIVGTLALANAVCRLGLLLETCP